VNAHGSGGMTYTSAAQSCVCGAGPCQSACANEFCLMGTIPTGDACGNCIRGALANGPCASYVGCQCELTDPDCSPYLACVKGCP
jgi:hypothetical protein